MSNIITLENKVLEAYNSENPNRADWSDWLRDHHVFIVADNASRIAKQVGANEELSRAAALLHDIADTQMKRFDKNHEAASMQIARELLVENGYSDEEIEIVVEDAIRYHSCHDGQTPKSIEGRVLAAADSLAHLQTDFYVFATWAMANTKTLDEIKTWVLKKLERDFNDKILFDEIKHEVRSDYQNLKQLYSR